MNRLFDEAWGGAEIGASFPAAASFTPRLDVVETDAALRVRVEVPGLEEKDLDVTLTGDVLVVKGEKRRQEETKDARWHRVETLHGSFQRALRLPYEIRGDEVKATCEKGVLTITLPKATPARGATRRIEVGS
jgi:HSP20 family protein